jgi:hypothetical protein
MATGMVKASERWLPVVYSRESSITTSWFKESRRFLTAIGFSLPLKTPFPPSISLANNLYEGAFENDRAHGQGIETLANGYRFFSPFKDSLANLISS